MRPMTPHRQAVREIERADRLHRAGGLLCGLGAAVFLLGAGTLGIFGLTNPKSTTSVYLALEGTGYMRWLFLPLVAVSMLFVVAGLVMLALARRNRRQAR